MSRAAPPSYFAEIQASARRRWDQLEGDPELAAPWHMLFKQVQNPRYVLSELIQNADDAEATTASARIEGNEFIFEHDGVDFEEEHFASICRFGYSNKRNLHTIGSRGIGFKSTFSLGDEVYLSTPTLSILFRISRFTEPVWRNSEPKWPLTQVRVRLRDESSKTELQKNLREWAQSSLSLLFFRHLQTLNIGDFSIRRLSDGAGPIERSEWVRLSAEQNEAFLLIRSDDEEFPPDAIEEIRKDKMSADDLQLPPCRVDLVLRADSERRLFAVLPTGVAPDLPFCCNAPFIQDPAKITIKNPEVSPTNRWLLERAGRVAAEAMLEWLARSDLCAADRCQAYELFTDVDLSDNSLEGVCATICEKAFEAELGDAPFLLTESSGLVRKDQCLALPTALHDVWTADQLAECFGGKAREILNRHVQEDHREVLLHWNAIKALEEDEVLDALESQHFPKPDTWQSLLALWHFVADGVGRPNVWNSRRRRKLVRIVPVQSSTVLHAVSEVVRIGEKKLLQSQSDWEFLAQHLLVLNQNWTRFLAQERRKAEEQGDDALTERVQRAYDVLETLGLDGTSDVDTVLKQTAVRFFAQEHCPNSECIRLAQIAACLGASVPSDFRYVTQNDEQTWIAQELLSDPDGSSESLINKEWYRDHALHRAYWQHYRSCTREVWEQWAASERSGLLAFVPLSKRTEYVCGRQQMRQELRERGFDREPTYSYKKDDFVIEDYDFEEAHWSHWHCLAKQDAGFWSSLLTRLLDLPTRYWASGMSARVAQVATTGSTRAVTSEPLLPGWAAKFRELPCLEDTHGRAHDPAALLRRTPETEALLDVEPFVKAELDTEQNRPLLIMLGVRDTPTGPEQILDRLRALSRSSTPPVYEVQKWCNRLDQLLVKCTTQDAQTIRKAFVADALILTESEGWCSPGEVFLNASDDAPGSATVHPTIRHLMLWQRIGVADHPTAELALQWLGELDSGAKLSADQLRRVRALLPRYAVQVWDECGHWLNLEGEWAPTSDLAYKLTMQGLVTWSNLFPTTKQKTADLQRLPADLCDQAPFSFLVSLASALEERVEDAVHVLAEPEPKAWMTALGEAIGRVRVGDEDQADRLRSGAARLRRTRWQPARHLEAVPYIDDTPAGTPRKTNVLWKDDLLYVADQRVARLFKAIAQELARPFDRQDIADAIKACVERSPEFVREYMEENFELVPAEQVEHAGTREEHDALPNADQADRGASQESEDVSTARGLRMEEEDEAHVGTATDDPDGEELLPEEEDDNGAKPRPKKPKKPSLMSVFAKSLGFSMDGVADRFKHEDGSWIERVHGASFPWQRYNGSAQLVQSYWVKDHCLVKEPLKLGAEVWSLCQDHPDAYTLVLVGLDGRPAEFTARRLKELTAGGSLKLYPAEYRLAFERTDHA